MPEKKRTNKHLLIWLFVCICGTGFAQKDYRAESITITDGLSQGFVMCLYADSRGFTWIGTFNGLNRYDGYKVKRFPPDQATPWALKANYIYCITEDKQGLLWMGTDKGLVVMDPHTERIVNLSDLNSAFPSRDVVQIIVRDNNRIWCSYRSPKGPKVIMVQPAGNLMQSIRADKIREDLIQMQEVPIPDGIKGPLRWLDSGNGSDIFAIDASEQFCRIDPLSLQVQKLAPQQIRHERMGPYGLVYYPEGNCGIAFLWQPSNGAGSIRTLSEFIKIPDEMPVLYRTGDSILYQLDTSLDAATIAQTDRRGFYRLLPTFLKLDKSVSYRGLADRSGNIWLGTNSYGARKISRKRLSFRHLFVNQSFYNFGILPDGRIWPGFTLPYKVFDPVTQNPEFAPWKVLDPVVKPHSFVVDKSGAWWLSGIRNDSFIIMTQKPGSSQWTDLPVRFSYTEGINSQLKADSNGNIWVLGLREEVARIRPGTQHVDRWSISPYLSSGMPRPAHSTCMAEGLSGTLWIGWNHGVLRITNAEGVPQFKMWDNYSGEEKIFKNDWILCLFPDRKQQNLVWIGTRNGGMHRLDTQSNTTLIFTEKNGLSDNVVYGILPDAFGNFWLSTNRGLSRFNPANQTFINFINEHPRLNTEFNTNSYQLMPSGELAFGSVDGLFFIRPIHEKPSDLPCVVEVTELKVNGTVLEFCTNDRCFSLNKEHEITLRLPYDQNSISLEFAALHTGAPASAQYRYRMLGLNKNWIDAGIQRFANFVLIPPGRYVIELQSINIQGNWENAPITKVFVTIVPPWYSSSLAYMIYACIFGWLIFTYLRYVRRHLRLTYAEEINAREIERLKSLDDFKNRFFGYISHEFKTPLTIILGQAKRMTGEKSQQQVIQQAGAILQQGQSMLEMVTQMVDITKLDRQEIQLNWRNGNITAYVKGIVESLRALTEFKDIELAFHTTEPKLRMDFDPLRLKYIVNNLLTNAVEHTQPGGKISVSIRKNTSGWMELEVSDTGKGIAPEVMPKIFERYFQVDPQSAYPAEPHFGLGLTFVKDLLGIFGGDISVQSELGKGSSFVVSLPVKNEAVILENGEANANHFKPGFSTPPPARAAEKPLPLLLIVEDNPFISNYLHLSLEAHFRLEFAQDGLVGYEIAQKHIPDLILTDVMMPGLDGFELTRRLKSSVLTGHVPIVMLSARSGLSDRLNGQEFGANAYIGKPFDEKELVLTLRNLHQLQQRWRERYHTMLETGRIADVKPGDLADDAVRQTDAFMLKIHSIFEKNYADDTYDLPMLCRDLEMSKSQLQRKLAMLSDMSAMELLRLHRLQKARELLSQNPDLTVKEICFVVGFKDPAHFSRLFSKTFQSTPSDVKREVRE